jgi:hypothetical protein
MHIKGVRSCLLFHYQTIKELMICTLVEFISEADWDPNSSEMQNKNKLNYQANMQSLNILREQFMVLNYNNGGRNPLWPYPYHGKQVRVTSFKL